RSADEADQYAGSSSHPPHLPRSRTPSVFRCAAPGEHPKVPRPEPLFLVKAHGALPILVRGHHEMAMNAVRCRCGEEVGYELAAEAPIPVIGMDVQLVEAEVILSFPQDLVMHLPGHVAVHPADDEPDYLSLLLRDPEVAAQLSLQGLGEVD